MKRIASLLICLMAVISVTVTSYGAQAVPQEVLDASDSVVRIFAGEYTGTGFIVAQDDENTYVATNYHVIEDDPDGAFVWLSEESNINASVLTYDKGKDLCILKIAFPLGLEPIKLSENGAQKGDAIYAVGFPGAADSVGVEYALDSESSTITDGIVSSIRRGPVTDGGPDVDILQVSAAINPGNSGGPVFNEKGIAVGVSTFGIDDSQGIFGAIAINELKDMLDSKSIAYVTDAVAEKESLPVWVYIVIGVAILLVIAVIVLIILLNKDKKKKTEQAEWTFVGGTAVDSDENKDTYKAPKNPVNWGKVIGITLGSLAVLFIVAYLITYSMSVKAADEYRFSDAYSLLIAKPITELHDSNHVSYADAGETMNRGSYEAAEKAFDRLGDYKSASVLSKECVYLDAKDKMQKSNYEQAYKDFVALGDYADSDDLAKECAYQGACQEMSSGNYDKAIEHFNLVLEQGDYKDAKELKDKLECEKIIIDWNEEESATNVIKKLSDLDDAGNALAEEYKDYFREIVYTKAVDMYHEGNYTDNLEMFRQLNDYKESDKYWKLCKAKIELDKIDFSKLGYIPSTGNPTLDAINAKYGLAEATEDTKVINIALDVKLLIPFEDAKDLYNYCHTLVNF